MSDLQNASQHILSQYGLTPQEELLETHTKKKRYSIGIPCETTMQEGRVPLAPLAVESLVESGHKVIIQKNLGKHSHFSDEKYAAHGAEIVDNPQEIFQCDIILKIAPFTIEEISMMKGNQIIMSNLYPCLRSKEYFTKLIQKRILACAYDLLEDDFGNFPLQRSMSEIAGNTSISTAAEYLSSNKGELLGGITGVNPSEVVILGAGATGEYAAKAALGLGAQVKVFDKSVHHLTQLVNHLNRNIATSILQPQVLERCLKTADVVIGAMQSMQGNSTQMVVSEEMVKQMKRHSVIIDLCIDQGGCFETSRQTNHNKPTFIKHGVVHYCVPNIQSRVARTASYAISNILSPILLELGETGSIKTFLKNNKGFRQAVYVFNGMLSNQYLGSLYDMYSRDINLLLSAM